MGLKASEKRSIMDLKGRDFLKLLDFTPEEIEYLLNLAADLKDKKKKGIPVDTLRGKNVALIFEKTIQNSLETELSAIIFRSVRDVIWLLS